MFIHKQAQRHFNTINQCSKRDPLCCHILNASVAFSDAKSPFMIALPPGSWSRGFGNGIDAEYEMLPHMASPMIYGPAPGVVRIVSDRIALPSSLSKLSILTLLPPDRAALYAASSPAIVFSPATHALWTAEMKKLKKPLPPKPKVHAREGEYVRLIRRMLSNGMVVVQCNRPTCVNGILAVTKDEHQDRLIIDARWANTWFVRPRPVRLATPSHLVQLQLPNNERLLVGKMDLSNYYHNLSIPEWMWTYLGLPGITAAELQLSDYSPDTILYPCCATLPMGWSHSVLIAQLIHERILYYSPDPVQPPPLLESANVLNIVHPMLVNPVHAVYIDDVVIIGPASAATAIKQQYSDCLAAYQRCGLPVKPEKCKEPADDTVTALGVEVTGDGSIRVSPERLIKTITATLHLLNKTEVSGRALSIVLGSWTWCVLVRRPMFSVLKYVYKFINAQGMTPAPLWNDVRRELMVLVGLAPLLSTSLRTPWFRSAIASDASTIAGGVVTSPLSDEMVGAVWPSTQINAVGEDAIDMLDLQPLEQPDMTSISTDQQRMPQRWSPKDGRQWSTIISYRWQRNEHINALEMRAAILAVRWTLSCSDSINTRLLLFVDSAVAYFVMRKGRSSSPQLNITQRRLAAFTLATGLSVVPCWVPSANNPADEPSRCLT
jgi:hypothetical protein